MDLEPARTRIQQRNRAAILEAALTTFASDGLRGATLDRIAATAGLSKPNMLYYFPSKEALYTELLTGLLDVWLAPLRELGPQGEPVDEVVAYVLRKLDMARRLPRESRLFANEIMQGAPRMMHEIRGPLRQLVDEKAALLGGWMATGRLARSDPRHLIFSICATTQHYADFGAQVSAILDTDGDAHFDDAAGFLSRFYRAALTPR